MCRLCLLHLDGIVIRSGKMPSMYVYMVSFGFIVGQCRNSMILLDGEIRQVVLSRLYERVGVRKLLNIHVNLGHLNTISILVLYT